MRLKTLRKERPAFENEGAIINGNRMDLSNNDSKQSRHRSNKNFLPPTSLHHDLSSLNISRSELSDEFLVDHPIQASTRHLGTESNESDRAANQLSAYQAIEAAYLEHGIRIHLNSSTGQLKNQANTPKTSSHRSRIFINRNPSRSSSALQYSNVNRDPNQDFRPFSALHQPSTTELDSHHIRSKNNQTETDFSQGPTELNNGYSSTSQLESDHSPPITPTEQTSISRTHKHTTLDNDPDIAYMTKLLTTTNGDAFRDTIRRRAGLRGTFAVHRHPSSNKNSSMEKRSENASHTQSSVAQRSSVLRQSVLPTPNLSTPVTRKVEKDIIKHASRIRTSHSKDFLLHHNSPHRSVKPNYAPSVSTSLTRNFNGETKTRKTKVSSQQITLGPLEMLLAPSQNRVSTPMHSFTQSSRSLSASNDDSTGKRYSFSTRFNESICKSSLSRYSQPEIRSNSPAMSNASTKSSDASLLSSKPFPISVTTTIRRKENFLPEPIDCDESIASASDDGISSGRCSSLQQSPGSLISARLTSGSTCVSKPLKKVSFGRPSTTYLITTST